MISALLATLGVALGVLLIIAVACYGFARIVLGLIGFAAGIVGNIFDKVRNK